MTLTKKSMLSISGAILLLGLMLVWVNQSHKSQPTDYQQYVKQFTEIKATQANELLTSSADAIIYIGRETCPSCVKFVPVLHEVSMRLKVSIYYVNSSEYDKDYSLQKFFNQYHISAVPTLLVYTKGQLSFPETPYTTIELEKLFQSYGYQ